MTCAATPSWISILVLLAASSPESARAFSPPSSLPAALGVHNEAPRLRLPSRSGGALYSHRPATMQMPSPESSGEGAGSMGLPGRRAALSLIPAAAAALWIPGRPPSANALEQGGAKTRVKLGKGTVPEMGTGTWAWGDGSVWGYGGYDKGLNDDSIREAWRKCLGGGVTFFDTAEVYGTGTSERIIGQLLRDATSPDERKNVQIATKFYPTDPKTNIPRIILPKDLLGALDGSLSRLGVDSVDLYQIHAPLVAASPEALADALAEAVNSGKAKAVGVSNYALKELMPVYNRLEKKGILLASNQVEYSLLRQLPESSGLIAKSKELGVTTLAYSPLAMGRLTGKYKPGQKPPGKRFFSDYPLSQIQPLIRQLETLGDKYGGKTPAQVALNWIICKGAVPIPGAKNGKQARDNAGATGWRLSEEDVASLEALGREGGTNVWQHDGSS